MTAVKGGPAGPDGIGGSYQNEAESDRSAWWFALGGHQGILKGFTQAGVGGLMALDVAAGAALVSELDGSGNVQDRGYLVWADSTTRVTFGAASASARNDALVAAFVDTEDGAVGTGALAVGAHLVVIPGVSGTTTVRTDAQIRAWLGRGGYLRLADVPIASTDTQINTANIVTSTTAGEPYLDRYLTASTGHTSSASYVVVNFTGSAASQGGMSYASSVCTVPTAGKYYASAKVAFDPNGTGTRWIWIQVNGAGGKKFGGAVPSAAQSAFASGSVVVNLAAGDTVGVAAYQNSGGTLNMTGGSDTTFLQVYRLGT